MSFIRVLPILFLTLTMFFYPQDTLKSASQGLLLWANFVLPALLPFFIVSDLLLKQGFVHFLGGLLEPLMRPLFRLPGKAAFVLAMTHTSGIPIGAILTSKLRQEGEITRIEGERLLAFTSNPSPGFMFGAVASGMLGNPALGATIAGSVYLANLMVGLIFRFYRPSSLRLQDHRVSFWNAFRDFKESHKKNKKPFGEMLADSVRNSISTSLLVGGFIVFFAVLAQMVNVIGLSTLLSKILSLLSGGYLSLPTGNALIQGLIETTLGCQATVGGVQDLHQQIGLIAFLLGLGGLSVFAQVASFVASTDLRLTPFVLGRILHAFLALAFSQVLLNFTPMPTMKLPISSNANGVLFSLRWSVLIFVFLLALLFLIGLIMLKVSKAR